jgi:hypothetical protein
MKYIVGENQVEKMKQLVQRLINSQLDAIREESEEWGMGEMDELHEIQSIDKIKINYITLSDKIKVYVDIYKSQNRSDFDNIRAEIQYRIEDLLPNIELYINDIIDERKFGPGIDW